MRFGVLGPLEVRTDALAPVVVPGAKERLLLAVLAAASPGVVGTDRLADVLWNGAPPVTARKSLQAHVVRLRSALEPDRPKGSTGRYVVRRGTGYALAVEREAIDALHMSDLAARGRAQLTSGDAPGAVRQLAAALDLWHGDPYADWPDAEFAEIERRRLAEVRIGATTALLEARLAVGGQADVVPEAERLAAEEPLREDWWRLLMLALYRCGRQADALAAGRRARAVLANEVGADPGPALREMEAAILAQDPALDLPPQGSARGPPLPSVEPPTEARRTATGSCPYKGLAAYQTEDAALFRGRQRLVAGLVRRLVDASVLVVSGPSGAGKSSVVRAGLIPALAGHALPGSGAWQPVIVTPGAHPVDALTELTGDAPPTSPVLLVCDQLEELWAPGVDRAEQTAFLDAVLGLLDDGVVVRCVAAVRGDHVGRLAEHASFTERLGGALVLVPPPTDPELRDVIAGPADSVGLSVEPELLDAVVGDVLGQAGALPLLSTALVGTWERRRGNLLTLAGYLEAGGVDGALTRSAEAAYASLSEEGRRLAQRMLVRLADSDDGGLLVRRPVPLDELDIDGEGGRERRTVVETFVGQRLLAVDGNRLEVAHEALLTAWPRLARWLDDDAAGRAVRRHLTPAALEWDAGGRPSDELYRGARLSAALDWGAVAGADVTPLEREFIDASQARADADLRTARERERRTRRLAIGLAGMLVVALLGAGLAVRYQRAAAARAVDAAAASTVADANRLAALSTTVDSLDVSLLLAAQAVRLAQTPETEDGLLASLVEHRRAVRVAPVGARPQEGNLADGVLFMAVSSDTEIVAWSIDSAAPPRRVMDPWDNWTASDASPTDDLLAGAGVADDGPWLGVVDSTGSQRLLAHGNDVGGQALAVGFTADGRRLLLVVGGPNGAAEESWWWELKEVDVATGEVSSTGIDGSSVSGPSARFSDDAETAVVWTDDPAGDVVVVDRASGDAVTFRSEARPSSIEELIAFDGGVAQRWTDGAVTLYDRSGRVMQVIEVRQAPVRKVAVSPDGTWAVTAGDGGSVDVWTVDPSTGGWAHRESLIGHAGGIVIAQADATGRLLCTVSMDGTAIIWDMTSDAGFGASFPGLGDRWIANRPQMAGQGLLVAPTRPVSRSGVYDWQYHNPDTLTVAATFLDPDTGRVVDHVEVGDTIEGVAFGSSVAVSPDRRRLAVTSALKTTVLDVRTREVLAEVVLPPTGDLDGNGEPQPAELVWGSVWTPDGSKLLLGTESSFFEGDGDGAIVVVDSSTWEPERRVDIGGVQTLEFSPDGRVLAAANVRPFAEIEILDADTLEMIHTVPLGDGDVATDLSFSPDGSRLAAGGELGRVHVLDTTTWRAVQPPAKAHDWGILQVEWMPDGRTVMTSGVDRTVALYDVARGLVRGRPLPASSGVGTAHTHLMPGTTDEIIALSGEQDGRRYPVAPSRWLAEACTVAGRDLTETEWSRYLPDRPWEPTCSDL